MDIKASIFRYLYGGCVCDTLVLSYWQISPITLSRTVFAARVMTSCAAINAGMLNQREVIE